MRTLTRGHLNITPIRARTSISLEALRSGFASARYKGASIPSKGFANLPVEKEEDAEPIFLREQSGRPRIVSLGPAGQANRKGLAARYAWDFLNEGLLEALEPDLREGVSARNRYLVDAVDVLVVPLAHRTGQVIALVASHNERDVDKVRSAIAAAVGANSWTPQDYAILRSSDAADFFLWIAAHALRGETLAAGLTVTDFRELNSNSPVGRHMRASRGIGQDRLDVLTSIAQGHAIGPVKLTVADQTTRLTVDLQILMDGSFDIHRGRSEYLDECGRASFGLAAARDVAVEILPKLVGAYENDQHWDQAARTRFATWARQRVIQNLGPVT